MLCYDCAMGWSGVAKVLINFLCRGVLLIRIIVGQGPIELTVGAGEGCLDIFSLVYISFLLSPSLEDGSTQIEILSQRTFKPKTNKPTNLFQIWKGSCQWLVRYECLKK